MNLLISMKHLYMPTEPKVIKYRPKHMKVNVIIAAYQFTLNKLNTQR